jgi:regulator of protease activity HflC (stomatin/prohibitin superfamily)
MESLVGIFSTAAAYAAMGGGIYATLKSTLFTNQQQQQVLITRFGKHIRTVTEAGLSAKIPFIDKIAHRVGMDVVQSSENLETKTKDDLFVKLPISVQYEVSDSALFKFKNRNAVENMMKLVSAAVRTAAANKQFQELYTDRDELSGEVITQVANQVKDFGINILRVIIDEPTAPGQVQEAFNKVRASERLRAAAENEAAANRIMVVAKSEADAEAQANAGKGAADFRKAILEGYKAQIAELTTGDNPLPIESAIHMVMQSMTLDTLREVADKGNVVIVPQDFGGQGLASVNNLMGLNRTP